MYEKLVILKYNKFSVKMEISPLNSVEEILQWQPNPAFESPGIPFSVSRSPKYLAGRDWVEESMHWDWLVTQPLKVEDSSKPRTLLCHDMMGGYTEDRFLQPIDKEPLIS